MLAFIALHGMLMAACWRRGVASRIHRVSAARMAGAVARRSA